MDNFRILVIDDEEIVRESLSDWLKKFGFYVETAENGAKGIEKIRSAQWNILLDENLFLRRELTKRYTFQDIIGKSPKIQEVFELVKTVGPTKSTILLRGASGTGKELVARAIHQLSPRNEKPFVAVSCAALTESLLESELFGHEKGAFTGAIAQKKGKFELADNGTIFLDEIGDIDPKTQADLLRVLQEREFTRVGGQETIKVDVRIIAATNKDLNKLMQEGKFRQDLYYRLNVITINIPPLQERREDIPLLCEHFLHKYNIENSKKIQRLSEDALKVLLEHNWPGNVRELEHAIEHAVTIEKTNVITVESLPPAFRAQGAFPCAYVAEDKPLDEVEKEYIHRVLKKHQWNIQKVAGILNIDRATLYSKIKKYNIQQNIDSNKN